MDGEFFKTEYYPTLRSYYTAVGPGDQRQVVLRTTDNAQVH